MGCLALSFNLAQIIRLGEEQAQDQSDLQQRTQMAAHLAEMDFSNQIDTLDRTLTGLAQAVALDPTLLSQAEPRMRTLLRGWREATPSAVNFYIFNHQAQLVNWSGLGEVVVQNVADRPYFIHHRARADGLIHLGQPLISRLNREKLIPVSRRLEDQNGRFLGVVLAGLRPDFLNRPPGVDYVAIVDQQGRILVQTPMSTATEPRTLMLGPLATDRGPWLGADPFGQPPVLDSVSFFVQSPSAPILAIARNDGDLYRAQWQAHLRSGMTVILAGNILLVTGGVALWRQMSRRRAAMDQLSLLNQDLEQRVSDRTAELQESQNRLHSFILAAQDAVVIIDHRGNIVEFNPSAERLFGFSRDETIGQNVSMLMPANDAARHDLYLAQAPVDGLHPVGRRRELIARRKDGHEFPVELSVGTHRQDGGMIHVGVIRDITRHKAEERQLRQLANLDGLTGLLNRRAFLADCTAALSAPAQAGNAAILMVDADHFKAVNDTHGHAAGDEVLRILADILSKAGRADDPVGRLGGEEFALFLPNGGADGAAVLAGRILTQVRAARIPWTNSDTTTTLTFTVSVGLSVAEVGDTVETLLARADAALYQAKQGGRDRFATA